jgi:hypothetical protein
MKDNNLTVPAIFRLQSHQLKDNYPQNLFEEKLVEFGYTPLDK